MNHTIYWHKKATIDIRKRIRERFGLHPTYTTISGETPIEVKEEDMPDLIECEKRGFIQIRKK